MDGAVAQQVLLTEQGVTVTPTRIEVSGKTYAMRNVTSVVVHAPGWGGGAILMVLAGGIATLSGLWQQAWGLAFVAALVLALGVFMGKRDARRRIIMLGSSSGEAEAMRTDNPAFAERVRAAIVAAMELR